MKLRGWECCLVFVVCYLCSHTGTSSNHRGLLAPVDVTAKVIGDKVRVQWKDNNQPELVAAVYIAVSKVNDGKPNSTAFIHAEDHSTKSITLFGLIPQMTYSLRVVLYTKDGISTSSTPVTVTMGSHLNEAVESGTHSQVMMEVNRVTQNSAMLLWKYPVTHSIHGLQSKLNCSGRQTYLMNGKTVDENYQTKSYSADALSKYTQEQLIEDLVPNVNYTCELATYNAASQKAFPIATAHFTTLVGVPRAPDEPRVDGGENGIKISLTATTNQFGPISRYTLIAVPVHKDKTQPITTRFNPLIPYTEVVGKAVSSQSASNSDETVAFIIGTYPGDALPSEVVLGNTDEVLSAFKPNQYYVFVLAAFTKSKESPASLFSLSAPSFPPFVMSNSLYLHVTQHEEEEAVGEASQMVVWLAVTIAGCGIAVIIFALGAVYALKRRGYKIPLKWSDKDDDGDDYVGLAVDQLVYGEKTYVPMKPLTSMHTQQSARVAAEGGIKFDNPHFDVAVYRTKGLLENLHESVDSSEASSAENPLQSPTENYQPPITITIRSEYNPLVSLNKKPCSSPFSYSTPGELEKLQTGTFSLPRSTGPIKTPRRRVVTAVTKSPTANKGIPTPAPCKLATVNNEEPPVTDTAIEKLLTATDVDEESVTMPVNDEEPITVATTDKQLSTTANINHEEPLTTGNNDQPPMMGTCDEETLTVNDKLPLTGIGQESLIATNNDEEIQKVSCNGRNDNDEEPLTTTGIEEEPLTEATIDGHQLTATNSSNSNEGLLTTTSISEEPLALATIDEEPLITTNTNDDEVSTTTNVDPSTTTSVDDEEAITVNTNTDEIPSTTTPAEEHATEQI